MKIVADHNIPFVREAFAALGDVQFIPGRQITAASVRDAELLLIRSVTPINAALLDGSKVKFVATATIGTDHVTMTDLAKRSIGFASAAGSNANSVAEYIVAAMLELAHRRGSNLRGKTLGVVGVGNVGSRVVRYAEALGMRVLQNDPPRERDENLPYFVPLDRVLAESDIITIHVPLTKSGLDVTFHMFDTRRLATVKRQPILINSSRGAVVDNKALLEAIEAKKLGGVVLDVWEGEPNISADLLAAVDLGTAHIAGYSFDGKINGTRMIYRAVCGFFGIKPAWEPALPPPPVPFCDCGIGAGEDDEDVLRRVIRQIYDITADDAALRKIVGAPDGIGGNFDKLRNEYGIRREFFNTKLTLRGAGGSLRQKFAALGFRL
jgi:erythronate-4-phosphate dehydrogenase